MTWPDNFKAVTDWFQGAPLRILSIIAFAIFFQYLINRAINRGIRTYSEKNSTSARQLDRARTTTMVLKSTLNSLVWVIAVFMVLAEFGLNLAPLIASAGVIGVALGLGAQTLVRDVLSGIFLLFEDQFGVGDLVQVANISGKVESVGLRITTIRDKKGVLWHVRNGEITMVGNASQPKSKR